MTARGFVGWQRQDNGRSIQEALETAILRFSGETARVFGAGRTDAGVHALGQVAHFDLARTTTAHTVADALNAHLRPQPVAVLDAAEVDPGFDARLSARERAYRYRILNRRAPLTVERDRAWLVQTPLDAAAMREAASRLVGRHDFSTFRASLCQARSPVKTLDVLGRRARRPRDPHRGPRAILPAPPGAQYRRHASSGGRGQVERGRRDSRARGARPQSGRPHRAGERALSDRGALLSPGYRKRLDTRLIRTLMIRSSPTIAAAPPPEISSAVRAMNHW